MDTNTQRGGELNYDAIQMVMAAAAGNLSVTTLPQTAIGREKMVEIVTQRILMDIRARDDAKLLRKKLCFTCSPTWQKELDHFLTGLDFNTATPTGVYLDLTAVTRVISMWSMHIQVGGVADSYSPIALHYVYPTNTQRLETHRIPASVSRLNRVLKVNGKNQEVESAKDTAIFDGFREFSLADIVNVLLRLKGGKRRVLFAVPYSEQLFNIVRRASFEKELSSGIIALESGYMATVRHGQVSFQTRENSDSFEFDVECYLELFTRAYIATDQDFDIQCEVAATLPGVMVMKATSVMKAYRRSAETRIREGDRLPGNMQSTFVVQSYAIANENIIAKPFFVPERDFRHVYQYARSVDDLKIDHLMEYASARLETEIGIGPTIRVGKTYATEEIIAIVQTAYVMAFKERYSTTQLLNAALKTSKFGDFAYDRQVLLSGLLVAIAGTVGLNFPFSFFPRSELILWKAGCASVFVAANSLSQVLKRVFLVVANSTEPLTIPAIERLEVAQTYTSLLWENSSKPLYDTILTSDFEFELEALVSVEQVLIHSGGFTYLKTEDGDFFDSEGGTYVRFDGKSDTERTVFSKFETRSTPIRRGKLWCSVRSNEVPSGWYALNDANVFLRSELTEGIGFITVHEVSANAIVTNLSDGVKSSVRFLSTNDVLPSSRDVLIIEKPQMADDYVYAPRVTASALLRELLDKRGYKNWLPSGYYEVDGKKALRKLIRIGKWDEFEPYYEELRGEELVAMVLSETENRVLSVPIFDVVDRCCREYDQLIEIDKFGDDYRLRWEKALDWKAILTSAIGPYSKIRNSNETSRALALRLASTSTPFAPGGTVSEEKLPLQTLK